MTSIPDLIARDVERIADALSELAGVALTDDEHAVLTEAVAAVQTKDGVR